MIAYRLTCIPTGKVYIGITRLTAEKRFAVHCRGARAGGGYYLWRALRKYPPIMWTVETIARASSWSELCEIERRLIALHKSTDPMVGYNLAAGGGGILGLKKTADQIERSAKHHRGKIVSQTTRQRLREAMLRRLARKENIPRTDNPQRDCAIARHYFNSPSLQATGEGFGIGASAVWHAMRRIEQRISECMGGMMASLPSPPKIHPDWISMVEEDL